MSHDGQDAFETGEVGDFGNFFSQDSESAFIDIGMGDDGVNDLESGIGIAFGPIEVDEVDIIGDIEGVLLELLFELRFLIEEFLDVIFCQGRRWGHETVSLGFEVEEQLFKIWIVRVDDDGCLSDFDSVIDTPSLGEEVGEAIDGFGASWIEAESLFEG